MIRQIIANAPDALPDAQPTVSKHCLNYCRTDEMCSSVYCVTVCAGQLRPVRADETGAGRESDEEVQLGAGSDRAHEGSLPLSRSQC